MDPARRIAFLAHARTSAYLRKFQSACRLVQSALAIGPAYVAFSGGKDSTVVLHMVRQMLPFVLAVWSDDVYYLPETMEFVQRLRGSGARIEQIRTRAYHTDWFQTSGDWDSIPDCVREKGLRVAFLGLRKEENSRRRWHLSAHGPLYLCQADGFWQCNPLHNWSVMDVWAYTFANNLDYNRAYDRLDAMGLDLKDQRIGPFACESAVSRGQLAILRQGWPQEFNRFADAHPEARSHA